MPGTLLETQVTPASSEVKIYWLKAGFPAETTSLAPSADMAMERHVQIGKLACVHVVPESAEV